MSPNGIFYQRPLGEGLLRLRLRSTTIEVAYSASGFDAKLILVSAQDKFVIAGINGNVTRVPTTGGGAAAACRAKIFRRACYDRNIQVVTRHSGIHGCRFVFVASDIIPGVTAYSSSSV